RNNTLTYHKYRHAFRKVMDQLGMKHSPHETRHTFISMLDTAGANHVCIKLLVGHSLKDITEKVYKMSSYNVQKI
ncbi:MAG: tyrosine-type recombinase/integrase, partial [Agathobacter sp.]|nr:tyrosine-type recombinase/integrase [Agathobacter sp.]